MSCSESGTTNLARVARMILDPCTGVLCALLTTEVTPAVLIRNVKTFISKYPNRRSCPIDKEQEQLVYGKDYSKFDISLLCKLLRNVPTIQPHSNKWGSAPDPRDRSVSANIERIRLIRNQCFHSSIITLPDSEFITKYQDIFTIIQELESYLGTDTIYQDKVKHIKKCSMDPEQEAEYIKQMRIIEIKLDNVLGKIFFLYYLYTR